MEHLRQLLCDGADDAQLDIAALELATLEYPDLDPSPFLHILDSHAVELSERLSPSGDGEEFVEAANEYLFEDLGFHGNTADYYDPKNSCLNEVLARRTGIPITLSLVYLEIARRLAKPVHGIGLPGHFLVQYADEHYTTFVDVFHGGRLLTAAECFELAENITGVDVSSNPAVLEPIGKREILVRMLNNLRVTYIRRQDFEKACPVLDLLLLAAPDSAQDYAQRALVEIQLRRYQAAKADLEKYLALQPDAADRDRVEEQIETIREYLSKRN